MERVCARVCLAVGAIALAMAATAVGAVAAPPRDLIADLAPVAARVQASPGAISVLDDEEHNDPTPAPSEDPGVDGDPHGGTEDPASGEEVASHEPMDMGGHMADPSPSAAPGHGHDSVPSPEPSPSDDPGAMPGMDDEEMASHPPASDGHDDAAEGSNDDASGGHGDGEPPAERPRAVVLGGFFALNGIALAGAAVLRRRDRAVATLKARRNPVTQPKKDASR